MRGRTRYQEEPHDLLEFVREMNLIGEKAEERGQHDESKCMGMGVGKPFPIFPSFPEGFQITCFGDFFHLLFMGDSLESYIHVIGAKHQEQKMSKIMSVRFI